MRNFLLTISLLMITSSAFCEYRVYQFTVKSKFPSPRDNGTYVVTSILPPAHYVSYHGGPGSITVDLVRTWMCKGYTGNRDTLCNGPSEKAEKT